MLSNYWSYESSGQRGFAAELYELRELDSTGLIPPGALNHWEYTDVEHDVKIGTVPYISMPYIRDKLELTSYSARNELSLQSTINSRLYQDITAGVYLPIELVVKRLHLDEDYAPATNVVTIWRGRLVNFEYSNNVVKLVFKPEETLYENNALSIMLSHHCGKALYKCGNFNAQDYEFKGLVSYVPEVSNLSYSGHRRIKFVLNTIPSKVPAFSFTSGVTEAPYSIPNMIPTSDAVSAYFDGAILRVENSDIILAVQQIQEYNIDANGNNVGTPNPRLMLTRRVPRLEALCAANVNGTAYASLYPGCNRMYDIDYNNTFKDCAAKFNNTLNFGGFPFVNRLNAFTSRSGGRR
jgi:hypothetical protein